MHVEIPWALHKIAKESYQQRIANTIALKDY
jgi:hypothetical protein